MPSVILGIDPGLTRCGFGIIEMRGNLPAYIAAGVIRTPVDDPVERRLRAVWEALEALVLERKPSAIAVERVYSQANVRTVMGTAQVSGLALLVAASHGVDVATYAPTEMKAAVTGNGRADKAQVTAMVQRLLKLSEPVKPADASDALGLAICHGWRGAAKARIAEAVAGSRT